MTTDGSSLALWELKIEVTHRCPLACAHCSSDASPSRTVEIDRGRCLSVLSEAAEMGVQEVVFSGGEPLLWDEIDEVVALASSSGMKTTIYTSGNADEAGRRLRELRQRGLRRAIFTLLGPTPTSHEYVTRITGSFAATVDAVRSAASDGLEAELHFVALTTNYRLLGEVAELGRSIGAPRVSVLRFVPQGRGFLFAEGSLGRLQYLELRRSITQLRREGYDIRTGSPLNFLMVNEHPTCRAGIDRLIIAPDLRIYPCDAFKQILAEEIVGTAKLSVLDKWSLKECWEGSPYLKAIRSHLELPFVQPCESCSSLGRCRGGCLAQKTLLAGTLTAGPDPMCLHRGG